MTTAASATSLAQWPLNRYDDDMAVRGDPNKLRAKAAAAFLDMPEYTFYRLAKAGLIKRHYGPYDKLAFYLKDELQAFKDRMEQQAKDRAESETAGNG